MLLLNNSLSLIFNKTLNMNIFIKIISIPAAQGKL